MFRGCRDLVVAAPVLKVRLPQRVPASRRGQRPRNLHRHPRRTVGLSVSTIRKYEQDGLLIAHRGASGHRLFSHEDISRVRYIHHLFQDLGMNADALHWMQSLLPCWALIGCSLSRTHHHRLGLDLPGSERRLPQLRRHHAAGRRDHRLLHRNHPHVDPKT